MTKTPPENTPTTPKGSMPVHPLAPQGASSRAQPPATGVAEHSNPPAVPAGALTGMPSHQTPDLAAQWAAYATGHQPGQPRIPLTAVFAADNPRHPRSAPSRPYSFTWHLRKRKYHHGSLVESALAAGLRIVARAGPMALTLRGLARELGVTASALVHFFGNRAGLRSAVAHAAAHALKPYSLVRAGGARAGAVMRHSAERWVAFAAENPNLYRLIFGEGWRGAALPTEARRHLLYSMDRIANIGQMSRHIRKGDPREHSLFLCAAIHGLAFSAADGIGAATPALIERFVACLE